jgi:hypothetical protein
LTHLSHTVLRLIGKETTLSVKLLLLDSSLEITKCTLSLREIKLTSKLLCTKLTKRTCQPTKPL